MKSKWASFAAVVVLAACMGRPTWAADACGGFTWNVAKELALFASTPQAATAGSIVEKAPNLSGERLYDLALVAQEQVHFAVPPGKRALADGAYGGIVRFRVPVDGLYRISLDQPFWIDVVADGKLVPSKDFQGRPGCSAPHKIVEFPLTSNRDLLLQFSNAVSPHVRVTVTPSAP